MPKSKQDTLDTEGRRRLVHALTDLGRSKQEIIGELMKEGVKFHTARDSVYRPVSPKKSWEEVSDEIVRRRSRRNGAYNTAPDPDEIADDLRAPALPDDEFARRWEEQQAAQTE